MELASCQRHFCIMRTAVAMVRMVALGVAASLSGHELAAQQQQQQQQQESQPQQVGESAGQGDQPHQHTSIYTPPSPTWQSTSGPFDQLNISLDLLFAVGTSSVRDAQILELQGGEHDPRKRGFTMQQAELQLNGAVDDWFTAQGVLVTFLDPETGETVVELEEAYVQSIDLPNRFQVRAGHYFTEFGRINPLHPHAWDWQSQPVILSRVFGPEGMRAPGARLAWLAPTHQYLEFFVGGQNANGGTMTSFASSQEGYEERAVGGRFYSDGSDQSRSGNDIVWTGRVATTFHLGEEAAFGIGASVAFGPNATGMDRETLITGVDFAYQWRPVNAQPGSAFVRVQGEYLHRSFAAAAQVDEATAGNPVLAADTLKDHGGYVYGLFGWDNGLAAGLRLDYATGSQQSYLGDGAFGRQLDAFRSDRLRLSPLMQYQVSRATRIRLQYDYDDSDHLASAAHSVWLGFEIQLGAQPVTRLGRDGMAGCSCR